VIGYRSKTLKTLKTLTVAITDPEIMTALVSGRSPFRSFSSGGALMIGAMIVGRLQARARRVGAATDTELVAALVSAMTRRGHEN
jgi:hypothetical protein